MRVILLVSSVIIILNVYFGKCSSDNNCIDEWIILVEGINDNDKILKQFKKRSNGMCWTWQETKKKHEGSQNGECVYRNVVNNIQSVIKWEGSSEIKWKCFGDKTIKHPAWNITYNNKSWRFIPSQHSWSLFIGNQNMSCNSNHYSEKEFYERPKRQTNGDYPRNLFEWMRNVLVDIFGTSRNSRSALASCSLIFKWLNALFNIGRGNGTTITTTTENPDVDYFGSYGRNRDIETATESKNKQLPRPQKFLEYDDYYK
uniref:Uncharacterized protein n=1 Tax=Clastoptera arizonana TaxID=38151 RepID=A0A1B6DDI2_9HEMI